MSKREPESGPGPERPDGGQTPGIPPTNGGPLSRARDAMGGRLEDAAGRVRQLGDRVAARNPVLGPTRPLAYDAARGIDSAAVYLRTRELETMKTDLETQVRRHPLAAVALAFLAGYAVRRLFW
jgi:hypothetical protein